MKMRWVKDQDGFTLVELILCIAIIGFVALILNRFLFSSTVMYEQEKKEIKLEIELQNVTDTVGDEMLECCAITTVPDPSGIRYLLRKSQAEAAILLLKDESLSLRRFQVTLGAGATDEDYDDEVAEQSKSIYDLNMIPISEHVQTLSITPKIIDMMPSDQIYDLSVTLSREDKEVSCNKQIALRNR